MTTIAVALHDQLQRAFEGEAWHGPALREALADVRAIDATQHPVPGAHSIWEIVLHLGGTYRLVLRRLDGDETPLGPDEDWPVPRAPTDEHWQRDVAELHALHTRLRGAVLEFPSERLFEPLVANPPYPAYTQFIGVTQHDLYHTGQIVLLKRALKDRDHAT
jgi:uncharacterized damage-inducible protein DinB